MIAVIESVARVDRVVGRYEGPAIRDILRLSGLPATYFYVGDDHSLAAAIGELFVRQDVDGVYLSAHGEQRGFELESGKLVPWRLLGGWLKQYFPKAQVFFVSTCRGGDRQVADALFAQAPNLRNIYGFVGNVPFTHTLAGFHLLFFLVSTRHVKPYVAAREVKRIVGHPFQVWERVSKYAPPTQLSKNLSACSTTSA